MVCMIPAGLCHGSAPSGISFRRTVLEHTFSYRINKIPNIDGLFLVFYDQSLWHYSNLKKKTTLSDRETITNFRIVQFLSDKNTYQIISRFEDTNFIDKINNIGKYLDGARKPIPFYIWSGGLDAGSLKSMDTKVISFSTKGFIPPTVTRPSFYKIDWIFNPRTSKLTATTLHWNIHEEPLPDGSDTKEVETIVDLTK